MQCMYTHSWIEPNQTGNPPLHPALQVGVQEYWWVGDDSAVVSQWKRWLRLWPRYSMAHCIPNGPFWSLPLSEAPAARLKHKDLSIQQTQQPESAQLSTVAATVDVQVPQQEKRKATWVLGTAAILPLMCYRIRIPLMLMFGSCISSFSHLLKLKPTRRRWWEEIASDYCHDTRLPHKLIVFIKPLSLSFLFWLSLRLAVVSQLIYMLMSLETDVMCNTQMPDFRDFLPEDRGGEKGGRFSFS